jgi:hypothetical protein
MPLEAPVNHDPKSPLPHTGRFYDGFGNKITMAAYANPAEGNNMAAGYGLVRFKKSTRQITMECWPRFVDVTKPEAKQYAGWPLTIGQQDNYGRKALAWLPTLNVKGQEDPVVQVVDEAAGEVVYTLRIRGTTFRPKVFREGTYTIHVGEGERRKTLKGVRSAAESDRTAIEVLL